MRTQEQVKAWQKEYRAAWIHPMHYHSAVFEVARILGYSDQEAAELALALNYLDWLEATDCYHQAIQITSKYYGTKMDDILPRLS